MRQTDSSAVATSNDYRDESHDTACCDTLPVMYTLLDPLCAAAAAVVVVVVVVVVVQVSVAVRDH